MTVGEPDDRGVVASVVDGAYVIVGRDEHDVAREKADEDDVEEEGGEEDEAADEVPLVLEVERDERVVEEVNALRGRLEREKHSLVKTTLNWKRQ